jgi:phosphatidylglycerophosphate synthase
VDGDLGIMSSTEAQPTERSTRAAVGILVVLAVTDAGAPAVSPTQMVAGLPLLERIALAARAAGYTDVLLQTELTTHRRPDAGLARLVLLPQNVVPQAAWLRSLLDGPLERERLVVDSSAAMVVETGDPSFVIEAAARAGSASALERELRARYAARPWTFETGGRFPLGVPADVRRAETWLLRSLIKQREGFMSRHFERRISLAITRHLIRTAITPNAMTAISAAVGLVAAPFFLSTEPVWQLCGALLFLAHSILDGCDGEIARLKFLQSRYGAVLDFWGDNLVHVAIFSCIGIGESWASGALWPLGAAALAVAGTLCSAAVMFRRTVDDRASDGASPSGRVLDALSSRDFIYVVIVLSAFGKAAWFLVASALGTPAFLAFALWLDHRHGRVR